MAYQRLNVQVRQWPHVEAFIRGPLEMLYFSDVHTMLRLPLREARIGAGCNFAIGHVLLAAVAGISTSLSNPGTNRYGRAFKHVLVDFYPWDCEANPPQTKKEKEEVAKMLWEEFRGPLTHHLGLWTEARGGGPRRLRDRGYVVKFKRLTGPDKNGLPENAIAQLERSGTWPFPEFQQTLQVRKDAKVLKVERFYWGIRRMVVRLTQQSGLMGQAENFLSDLAE